MSHDDLGIHRICAENNDCGVASVSVACVVCTKLSRLCARYSQTSTPHVTSPMNSPTSESIQPPHVVQVSKSSTNAIFRQCLILLFAVHAVIFVLKSSAHSLAIRNK